MVVLAGALLILLSTGLGWVGGRGTRMATVQEKFANDLKAYKDGM